jgi:hypothetical protein
VGLTTETVHVATAGLSAGEAERFVAAALRRSVLRGDFEEMESEEAADRTLYIRRSGEWFTIHDTSFGSAEQLAAALSKEADAPAVAITVSDSDEMNIRVWARGRVTSKISARAGERAKGSIQGLVDLAGPAVSRAAFEEALNVRTAFVEDKLTRLAPLLGLNSEWMLSCVEDVEEQEETEAIRLWFRSTLPVPEATGGAPDLQISSWMGEQEFAVGEAARNLGGSILNRGGDLRGLTVRVDGNALENGLIRIDSVTVTHFPPGGGKNAQPIREVSTFGPEMEARFDEVRIPGLPEPPRGLLQMLLFRKYLDQERTSNLYVSLEGAALEPGSGGVRVRLTPQNGDARTGIALDCPVRVHRPSASVLKHKAAYGSRVLRDLERGSILQGLVSLERVTGAAANAIDTWSQFVAGLRLDTWQANWCQKAGVIPQMLTLRAPRIGSAKVWRERLGELARLSQFHGHIGDREHLAGFYWQTNSVFFSRGKVEPLPHLVLFADQRAIGAEHRETARELLDRLLDELMADGLQAYAATWGPVGPEGTTYEMASGLHGQCVTGRTWCERYVRGVSRKMWFAGALLGKIARVELEALGDITPLANGAIRFELSDTRPVADLEAVLRDVIAGEEEWRQGVRALYSP